MKVLGISEPSPRNVWKTALAVISFLFVVAILAFFFAVPVYRVVREWYIIHHLEKRERVALEEEGPDFESALAKAMIYFQDRDYLEARRRFGELQRVAQTELMQWFVEGYVTATFDGAGQPEAGIDYLCETYRDRPLEDVRSRFGFQVHLREISRKKGFKAAEDLITKLRTTCKRADLSYVWPGIPRVKAENLKNGATLYEDSYELSESDLEYLEHVVQRYPDDPFLDHALYFLQYFDDVIQDYKGSYILEVAYRAAGQRALRARNYVGAIHYLTEAAKQWPRSSHWDDVVVALAEAHRKSGNPEAQFQWLSLLRKGKGERLAELLEEKPLESAEEVRAFLRQLQRQQEDQLGNLFNSDCTEWFRIANYSLWSARYDLAMTEYEEAISAFSEARMDVPWCIGRGLSALQRVVNSDRASKEDLFRLGFFLRDEAAENLDNSAFESAAAVIWKKCSKRFPGTSEAEKSLYLAAALERRMKNYSEAAELFRKLADEYPQSGLADDALTELGWYYYFIESNNDLAREYFRRVAREHAKANAADNALNWLARSYCETSDYGKALSSYNQLVELYGHGRLAQYARSKVDKLKFMIKSRRTRNTVLGLQKIVGRSSPTGVYIAMIDSGSDAENAGLQETDMITAIDGRSVDSKESFYRELALARRGSTVLLNVTRSRDTELEVTVKISIEVYYEKIPENLCS